MQMTRRGRLWLPRRLDGDRLVERVPATAMRRLPPIRGGAGVTFDARMTGGNGSSGNSQQIASSTSISSTGMTVGSSATLIIGMMVLQTLASSPAMTWDGVAMTNRGGLISNSVPAVAIFTLVSPATGNKTLAGSWTGSSDCYMSCVSFAGTDTVTGVATGDTTSGTGSPLGSLAVTSSSDGATVVLFGSDNGDPTMNFNAIFVNSPFSPGGGASYQLGGSSNSHTFTGGSVTALVGVHVIAGAAPPDPSLELQGAQVGV